MKLLHVVIMPTMFLTGCVTSNSFLAAGVHEGEKYKIEVQRGGEAFDPKLFVRLNDELAMVVDRKNSHVDPNCERPGFYAWRCTYTGDYKGMKLKVVENLNAVANNSSLTYDTYLDGEYLETVVGSLF